MKKHLKTSVAYREKPVATYFDIDGELEWLARSLERYSQVASVAKAEEPHPGPETTLVNDC